MKVSKPFIHALKFHPSKAPRLLGRRRAHVHVGHQLMRPRQAFLNLRGQATTNHQILVVGCWPADLNRYPVQGDCS